MTVNEGIKKVTECADKIAASFSQQEALEFYEGLESEMQMWVEAIQEDIDRDLLA